MSYDRFRPLGAAAQVQVDESYQACFVDRKVLSVMTK